MFPSLVTELFADPSLQILSSDEALIDVRDSGLETQNSKLAL